MKKILLFMVVLLFATSSCTKTNIDYFSTLCGTICDYATGDPIAGANVVLSPGGVTKITGSDGYFEFSDITPQQYTITVQKTGYETNRKSVNAISGSTTEVSISLKQQK